MDWFNKYDGKFYWWNEDDDIIDISDICFKQFEKTINFKNNTRKITEEEFYQIKTEFYKGFRSTCYTLKYDNEKSTQIWKLVLEKIEMKRRDLFESKRYYTNYTGHTFDYETMNRMWEELRKNYRWNNFYNFNPFEGFSQNNSKQSYNTSYQSIEISFKYFEINKSTATIEEVNKKFRLKSLEVHPDKPTGTKEKFQECLNHKENCLNYLKGK